MLLLTVSAWTWLGELQMEVKPSSMEEKNPLYLPSEGGGKDSSLPDNTFKSAILSPEINFSCPPFAKVL